MKIGMSFLGIDPFSTLEPMTHMAQKSEQCGFEPFQDFLSAQLPVRE
jgi:hypothetical protein